MPRAALLAIAAPLAFVACGGPGAAGGRNGPPAPTVARATSTPVFDATPLYRQMGLLARGDSLPFLGRTAFLASGARDTTHVVVGLSLTNSALRFAREADTRYRARYGVTLTLARGAEVVRRVESAHEVVVGSFRETARTDESVLYQEILDAAPGRYTLTVALRDEESSRSVEEQLPLTVPAFGARTLSTPLPIHRATARTVRDTIPEVLMSPRGTAAAGRDSVLLVYLEGYGLAGEGVELLVRNERGRILHRDSVRLPTRGGGDLAAATIPVPVARIGIGVGQLTFVPIGGTDSSSTYVFVGFGEDLPIASFDDMLSYLRHFAAPHRISTLRGAPEEERPEAWATFMHETDSEPRTAVNEDLRQYFSRLVRANVRFREETTPGWMTDRGKVFISLGDPDVLMEPAGQTFQRGRQQVWEYSTINLQLVFYDQTGTGRWRLTQTSDVRFEQEYRRRLK